MNRPFESGRQEARLRTQLFVRVFLGDPRAIVFSGSWLVSRLYPYHREILGGHRLLLFTDTKPAGTGGVQSFAGALKQSRGFVETTPRPAAAFGSRAGEPVRWLLAPAGQADCPAGTAPVFVLFGTLRAETPTRTTRNPTLLLRLSGVLLLRYADRKFVGLLFHEPPRNTREVLRCRRFSRAARGQRT